MAHRPRQQRPSPGKKQRPRFTAAQNVRLPSTPNENLKPKRARPFAAVFLVNPSYEAAFIEESEKAKVRIHRIDAGIFSTSSSASTTLRAAFARQILRDVLPVHGNSPGELAQAIMDTLLADEELGYAILQNTLQLEVILPDVERLGSAPLRPHALTSFAKSLQQLLEKKCLGRGVKKGLLADKHKHSWQKSPERFLQVLLQDERNALVERVPVTGQDDDEERLATWPAPFAAGRAQVPFDANAPSSAHRKFEEALFWLGMSPNAGDVVIDCGAAPGGWSYVALELGAKVIAVDRGKMDEKLLRNPRLQHLRKDAFAHAPLDEATWMICDIIAEPEKSLELLEKALVQPQIKAGVLTLKLKHPIKWQVIDNAKRALIAAGVRWDIRNLVNNKLEVSVLFRRASLDGTVSDG
ncbi:MAG: hypothetical protein GY822_27775 [Deltaproteobacteria bacterium]|nr:hypothetical protein [Deltaproteobacteria bacterium]